MFPTLSTATTRPIATQYAASPNIQFGQQAGEDEYKKIQAFLNAQGLDGDKLDPKQSFVEDFQKVSSQTSWRVKWKMRGYNKDIRNLIFNLTNIKTFKDAQPWGAIQTNWGSSAEADDFIVGYDHTYQEGKKQAESQGILYAFDYIHLRPTPTQVISLYYRRGTFPPNFVAPTSKSTTATF